MEKKILEGQRKSPTKNEVIGGYSSSINNNNSIFAVEELSINPDGTKSIKFIKDLQDKNIPKIKKNTQITIELGKKIDGTGNATKRILEDFLKSFTTE